LQSRNQQKKKVAKEKAVKWRRVRKRVNRSGEMDSKKRRRRVRRAKRVGLGMGSKRARRRRALQMKRKEGGLMAASLSQPRSPSQLKM